MKRLYLDTGPVIALLRKNDSAHKHVKKYFASVRASGIRLVTAEAVISEAATRIRYDCGLHLIPEVDKFITSAIAYGLLEVRDITNGERHRAFQVMYQFGSLSLSYADAVGAVIAQAEETDGVFSLDNDFRVMGFEVVP